MSMASQTTSVVSRKIGDTPAADLLPVAGHNATIDFLLANASHEP